MSETKLPSRRAALKTIGAGVTAAATCAFAGDANALAQLSQTVAGYQDHPHGNDLCGTCPYFQAPSSCAVVAGTVSVNGWCNLYAPFPFTPRVSNGA